MKKKFLIAAFLILSIFSFAFKVGASETTGIGIVTTSGSSLNVRTDATTNSSVIGQLKNNSYITIVGIKNGFYHINYDNTKYGYAKADYIKKASATKKTVKTITSELNVRSGPSTSYSVVKKLPNNKSVYVISEANSWSKIIYDGSKVGYCYSSYLTSGVNLTVTNYKQFDSRWSNVVIKNGKTMKQIGCLTTALAITESYRTKTTITPLMMKNKSSYTATGAIYWPSNYSFITNKTNYLGNIKNLLDKGKPVILGCTNKNGGQHFIVVTGYSGSGTSAKSFTISDPGSSYRTNLSEFLVSYPNFYKIAYYN